MEIFDVRELRKLYVPDRESHKAQNGKVMVIGGSELFHAASIWALEIASKIVDMVFYASVPTNNEIVKKQKQLFKNGIVITRDHINDYMKETDAVLIGPGMLRTELRNSEIQKFRQESIEDILTLKNEGEQTYFLTKYLLKTYPEKKWVIDAGALQMIDVAWLHQLQGHVILTPHHGEFERVFQMTPTPEHVEAMAKEHNVVILMKGHEDVVCSPKECVRVLGGNAGMTKGGTGDVLAGLTVALFSQNDDPYLVAKTASYLNKKAGDSLFEKVGYYFNATDLLEEIPGVIKQLVLST